MKTECFNLLLKSVKMRLIIVCLLSIIGAALLTCIRTTTGKIFLQTVVLGKHDWDIVWSCEDPRWPENLKHEIGITGIVLEQGKVVGIVCRGSLFTYPLDNSNAPSIQMEYDRAQDASLSIAKYAIAIIALTAVILLLSLRNRLFLSAAKQWHYSNHLKLKMQLLFLFNTICIILFVVLFVGLVSTTANMQIQAVILGKYKWEFVWSRNDKRWPDAIQNAPGVVGIAFENEQVAALILNDKNFMVYPTGAVNESFKQYQYNNSHRTVKNGCKWGMVASSIALLLSLAAKRATYWQVLFLRK